MPEYQIDRMLTQELEHACDMLEDLLYEMEQDDMDALEKQREENKRQGLCNWHISDLNVDLHGIY